MMGTLIIKGLSEFKAGLSPSKINLFYLLHNENPSKMMKNAYFVLKAYFVHKIFIFLTLYLVTQKKPFD